MTPRSGVPAVSRLSRRWVWRGPRARPPHRRAGCHRRIRPALGGLILGRHDATPQPLVERPTSPGRSLWGALTSDPRDFGAAAPVATGRYDRTSSRRSWSRGSARTRSRRPDRRSRSSALCRVRRSSSRRVRPWLSRYTRPVVLWTIRLPSASVWTLSVTTSAKYGAPFTIADSTGTRRPKSRHATASGCLQPLVPVREVALRRQRFLPLDDCTERRAQRDNATRDDSRFIFYSYFLTIITISFCEPDCPREAVLADEHVRHHRL